MAIGYGILFLTPLVELCLVRGAFADLPDFAASARYSEVKRSIESQKWAEAEPILAALHAEYPRSTEVSEDLIRTWTHLGRRAEAIALIADTLSRERGDERLRLIERQRLVSRLFFKQETFQVVQEGLTSLRAEKYRAAREKFAKALESEPDNVEILLRMGQAQVLEREPAGAVERLKLAVKLNPYEPELRLWLGRALQLQGDLAGGLVELRQAHTALPKSLIAGVWMVEALVSTGQKAAALQLIESDLKNFPLHVPLLVQAAEIKAQFAPRAMTTDLSTLWSARKDLQVALSRLDAFVLPANRFEGELGLDLRRPKDPIAQEIADRMTRIDAQIRDRTTVSAPRLDSEPTHP